MHQTNQIQNVSLGNHTNGTGNLHILIVEDNPYEIAL